MTPEEALRHGLREMMGDAAAKIEFEGHTLQDAGCDDLDAMEVIMTIEECLDIEIKDSDLGWEVEKGLVSFTCDTKLTDIVSAIKKAMDAC